MLRGITLSLILALSLGSPAAGDTITLGVGDSTLVGGLGLGFSGVPMDSRCPLEALCFWEGDGVAEIWAKRPLHLKTAFELHTHSDFQRSVVFGDYRITLLSLDPYPQVDTPTDPDEYEATLLVECLPVDADKTTWSCIKELYRNH